MREAVIEEEWRIVTGVVSDEIDRSVRRLPVKIPLRLYIVNLGLYRWRSLSALPEMWDLRNLRVELGRGGVSGGIGSLVAPPPFIIALIVRKPSYLRTNMPLAVESGLVAGIGQ